MATQIVSVGLSSVFMLLVLEKFKVFTFFEDKVFPKIGYSETCYFCWSFWTCLLLCFGLNPNEFFIILSSSTVVSRYVFMTMMDK